MPSTVVCGYFVAILIFGFSLILEIDAKDIGKLECSETDGMKPDSKLLNLIISKCQPKQGQDEKTTAACLVKCLMKQQKALDKKGKIKKKEGMEIIKIFDERFRPNITIQFEECYSNHNDQLKKEPNGCESWLPYTGCFFDFAQGLCPKVTATTTAQST